MRLNSYDASVIPAVRFYDSMVESSKSSVVFGWYYIASLLYIRVSY